MSDMQAMLQTSGLSHVLSVTRYIQEADCVVAKATWANGRRVDVKQVCGLQFLKSYHD